MEAYYYSKMDKYRQQVYHGMFTGLMNLQTEIALPRLEGMDLYDVFFQLRLDHPEIFWTSGYSYKYFPESGNITFVPEYIFEKAKIKEHQKAMKSRVEKLARPAIHLTEWEKEQYIHDFICENVYYDKLKKPYSPEIIGPLGQGVGVCEGIAKSVKILCDALGIWCIIALCGSNPEKGIKYRHTWNIVRIDGTYYHLDATFDNTLGKGNEKHRLTDSPAKGSKVSGGKKSNTDSLIRYDYFNLDDKNIFRDHEPLIAPAPKCTDGNHTYYREKKLSFAKVEDVYKRSLQAAKKGKVLTFHWKGGYLTREVLDELLQQIHRAGAEKGKTAVISLNWPQAVIRLHYVENAEAEDTVEMEDANEGEKY